MTTHVENRGKRVLIVDDEPAIRSAIARLMGRLGYQAIGVGSGEEALARIQPDIDLVLLDVNMSGIDGFEVTRQIRARPEVADVPIILITTLEGREDRLKAVEAGVSDFIAKPIDVNELKIRTNAVMQLRDAKLELSRQNEQLETLVTARTEELNQALDAMSAARDQMEAAQLETLHRLAMASEFKDKNSAMHIRRVGRICSIIAREIDLSAPEVQLILRASPLHDVGKLGIPDSILLKPGKLTESERFVIQRHTVIGAEILSGSSSEILQLAEIIAISHHEWWNGKGYPNGLAGTAIPLSGRICAVADVFDALTSVRPHKKAFSNEKAIGIIEEGRGTQFEPRLLDAFLKQLPNIEEVQRALRDRPPSEEQVPIAQRMTKKVQHVSLDS